MKELERLQKEIGAAYSVMPVDQLYKINSDLTDLQKQNDELRAKLAISLVSEESLRLAIKSIELAKKENSGYEPSLSVYQREVDNLISLASKRPEQSLADIRAEAVMSIIKSDLGFSHTVNDFESEWVYSEDDIKDHANRIKEG